MQHYTALTTTWPSVIIWCQVVDNYGDAGVCLRLANTLIQHGHKQVWLCIDQPHTLAKILPGLNPTSHAQLVSAQLGIVKWSAAWESALQHPPLQALLAQATMVTTFACKLPLGLRQVRAIAQQKLCNANANAVQDYHMEYLTLANWAVDLNGMQQTDAATGYHSTLIVPGLVPGSAGVLAPLPCSISHSNWWQALLSNGAVNILLFTYAAGHNFVAQLLSQCHNPLAPPVQLWVAPGHSQAMVKQWLAANPLPAHANVCLVFLPWLAQHEFDALIGQVDLAIVRGEDSAMVANVSSKRFVWQLYQEDGGGQLQKLDHYLTLHPWSNALQVCFRWLNDMAIPSPADGANLMRGLLFGDGLQVEFAQWRLHLSTLACPSQAIGTPTQSPKANTTKPT